MPKTYTSREIIRRLRADGWQLVRTRGSHRQYRRPGKPGLVTVPHPKRTIAIGTMRNIFRKAGWNWPPAG